MSGYRDLNPDFIKSLLESIYVDDLTTGTDDAEEGFLLYKNTKEIMSSASFLLRKWKTNSRELRKLVKESEGESQGAMTEAENSEEDEPCVNLFIGSSNKPEKPCEGNFRFDSIVQLANSLPATKRNLSRVISTVFDPLGHLHHW